MIFRYSTEKNGDINVYGYGQSMTFRIVISSRKLKFANTLQQQKNNGQKHSDKYNEEVFHGMRSRLVRVVRDCALHRNIR